MPTTFFITHFLEKPIFKLSLNKMTKELFYLFSAILFLFSGLTHLWADDGFRFKRQNLKVDGEIIGKMYEDLDGDSLIDLVVFSLQGEEGNSKRMVGFFKQQSGSGFDTIPHQVFELDKKASVVDLADMDKDGKKGLLFLAEDGVYYYSLQGDLFNNNPSLLFSTTTFLSSPEERVMIWDFCPDLGDKNEMVIIPQKRGYDIWTKKDQGEFVLKGRLGFKPDISLSSYSGKLGQNRGSIKFSYEIPGLIFTDYDKDGKKDILMLDKDKMYVFLSKEDGFFQEQADKIVALKSKGKEEKQEFEIDDINGDGVLDLILNESKGDLEKGSKTKISIYMGKEAEGFQIGSPHQIISSEKEASDVLLCDLNKDGKKEMIMLNMGFSLGSMIKVLLTKSIKFNLYVRSLGAGDLYPKEPNRKLNLGLKVSFSEESNQPSEMGEDDFSGDFNGDGLTDFFYAAGDNVLKFFLGRKGDFFADKPQYEMGIEIPAGRHKIIDLNNDGKSDIIFSFEKKDLKDKIVVLFSNM